MIPKIIHRTYLTKNHRHTFKFVDTGTGYVLESIDFEPVEFHRTFKDTYECDAYVKILTTKGV